MANRFRLRPITQLLLATMAMTAIVWVLRGVGLLAFLPGIIIWLLILACFAIALFSSVQSTR
ncbi:hypothetical protein IQ260_24205 [Leptolyngbya cf. ectocarpi LEGE 11479]|uniref:Uncharacterized protein n=1 Tax=Leptolyngbya cf. ectocarpi LEGE 11479 TaxID=1828722 RepID=A0A928ZYH2_LEPEC|nr:hypothetical protein [Leptolyngbya ectocarpi]MBE9069751.1 hypothetical protein [Leptolyngbya cf. ectocarpi LEGE 11479]